MYLIYLDIVSLESFQIKQNNPNKTYRKYTKNVTQLKLFKTISNLVKIIIKKKKLFYVIFHF